MAQDPVKPTPRWRRWLRWGLAGTSALLGILVILLSLWALIYRDAAIYLVQSAQGQSQLLFGGETVSDLLADSSTPEPLRKQLQLVQEVKRFAESELKLKPTRNYERYVDLKRDYLVMVLTASPPLKMESKTWWFPIVGTVPYKGYFDLDLGKADEASLQAEGYETHFRGSPAYSTLGWFHDPLINTMLQYGEYYLINTVIHESVHATHWVPGEVTFNENMASFIGNQGALAFYAKKYGKGSDRYRDAAQQLVDQTTFAQFMNRVGNELEKVYNSDRFEANKREDKVRTLAALKREYVTQVAPRIKTPGYLGFEKREWNNAMVMSYRHYNQDQDKLEKVFDKVGRDIPRMMSFLQQKDVLTLFRSDTPSPETSPKP
ncbi:MAG: aminopeptidase [Candidatus Sericytochromatia bacterium]